MEHDEIRLRLIRADDVPASHELDEAYVFGLQDTRQTIVPGERQADGTLVFDFTLRVKPGADPDYPVFLGRFASGPVPDRFVYLSWRSVSRGSIASRRDWARSTGPWFAQPRERTQDWSRI
jgi:hypothetical protein